MEYDYDITKIPDLFSVKGKVALITGGSSGLGLNMAHGLVRNGCKVYISSRKQAQCDAAVKELSQYGTAVAIACDASSKTELDKLAATITKLEGTNGVHFVIANAGATWGEPFESHPEPAFAKVMDLNVKSVFYTVQVMLPLLEKAGTASDPARVITTGSVAGLKASGAVVIPYATSKAAVHHMIRSMSLVLGPKHITCNAIAPGMFPSKMTRGTLNSGDGQVGKALEDGNPMGRLGLPKDIIGVSLFLCSPAGAYVNGVVIPLDGASYMVQSFM